ncbi:hypothetical protein BDW67DRAFT_188174 [Aspergillus spinulosporus]
MAVPACIKIRERLYQEARDADNHYFPRSRILSVFTTDDCLSKVYFCDCPLCRQDFRNSENRRQTFDPQELLGQYATVYALLICLHRPGLIRYFQKHRKPLSGTYFFTADSLQFLIDEGVQLLSIIEDILHNQYRFQIRAIDRSREPFKMHPREVLPIRQNRQQAGQGSFGQVYGFEFAYDEYRGQGLRDISRFARKIFHHDTAGLVEWFNLLHFDRLQHPHLMSALAAFWHEDRFSIVFEEAEITLGGYLENGGSLYTHEALWDQVRGLADGLAYLHGRSGSVIAYHGDLKPSNILIVKGRARLFDQTSNTAKTDCGILLFDGKEGKSLLIQCVLYDYNDANVYIFQEPFMRLHQDRPSFDPEYTDRNRNRPSLRATLQQWDGRRYTFEFVEFRDLLILQAAMTKQYAFNFSSFNLRSLSISEHGIPFSGRRRLALEFNGAVVQLWSEKPLREDQILWPATLRVANPRMHIAVICRSEKKLLLIKVSSKTIAEPVGNTSGTLTLKNVHHYEIPMKHGLPMHIPEAESGYTQHKKAHLSFDGPEAEQNARSFQQQLEDFQKEWEKNKRDLLERPRR